MKAKRYEGRIRKGGILLSVHCDNSEWASKAKNILENTGADDVSSTSEASADFARSDKPMPRTQVYAKRKSLTTKKRGQAHRLGLVPFSPFSLCEIPLSRLGKPDSRRLLYGMIQLSPSR
jgi:hypothetical protein